MRRFASLAAAGALTLAAALFAVAPAAQATFPGANGKIAFSTDQNPNGSDIFTVNPDGSGETQLTHGEYGNASTPNWSPDGTKIVFNGDVSGMSQLYVMNWDGSGGHLLFADPTNGDAQARYSPDGKQIVFQSCGQTGCTIDVIAADGSGSPTVLTSPLWFAQNPSWSPNGSTITFESNQDGLLDAVWVMDANGLNQHRLTAPSLEAGGPDWSPDGKHIIFGDHCCLPHSNVWVMNADGSNQTQITHVPKANSAGFARYSPDGTKILLISNIAYRGGDNTPFNDLYTMDPNGTHMRKIVSNEPYMLNISWGSHQ
jgi:TolB protein